MFNLKNILILVVTSLVAGFIATMAATEFAPFIAAFVSALLLLTVLSLLPAFATRSTRPDTKNNHKQASRREKGIVKWFDSSKGYGFITRAMGEDIFVHFRSIRGKGHRSLHEGQNVEFSVTDSDKGPQAEDITVLK